MDVRIYGRSPSLRVCAEISKRETVHCGHIDWACVLALDWLRFYCRLLKCLRIDRCVHGVCVNKHMLLVHIH